VSLTVVGLIAGLVSKIFWRIADIKVVHLIISTTGRVVVPLAVLVINVVVAVLVRRAASSAASTNLGVQPHHQQTSTSNNSAVPTVMLVATSIIYAVLYSPSNILFAMWWQVKSAETRAFVWKVHAVAAALMRLVFAYNFYVYLITGRRFHAELRKLLCRCLPSFSSFSSSSVV